MNNRNHYNTGAWEKKDIILTQIAIGVFGIFMGVMLFAVMVLLWSPACAEDEMTYSCWVICQPDQDGNLGEVIIRERPSRNAAEVGAVVAGTRLRTDWKESGKWLHLVDLNNETGEGWICINYIVFDEPIRLDLEGVIKGKGRVACRKSIGGELRKWANPGQELTVYWYSSEWVVTDRGYIQSQFVEIP